MCPSGHAYKAAHLTGQTRITTPLDSEKLFQRPKENQIDFLLYPLLSISSAFVDKNFNSFLSSACSLPQALCLGRPDAVYISDQAITASTFSF